MRTVDDLATPGTPPIGVSAVVRFTTQVHRHPAGTIALVIDQAPYGRNRYRVMVPGDPHSFTPLAAELEVIQGVDPDGWWRRQSASRRSA